MRSSRILKNALFYAVVAGVAYYSARELIKGERVMSSIALLGFSLDLVVESAYNAWKGKRFDE